MRIKIEGGKPFWPDRLYSHLHNSLPHHPKGETGEKYTEQQAGVGKLRAVGQCPTQMLSFLLQKAVCGVGRAVLHRSLCRGEASWGGEWLGLLEKGST